MTIVRWEPLRELGSLQNEMNRLFNTVFDTPVPGNGGSTTDSSTSDSSSMPSNPGANDTANPTTTRISAGSSPRRCAMAVTTMAPTTTRISSTRRLSPEIQILVDDSALRVWPPSTCAP